MSKKIKTRVPDYIAKELGLEINKSTQYRLTPEQYKEKNRLLEDGSFKKSKIKEHSSFDLTAWTKEGKIMSIDEFCEFHNLNRGDISTWRLCTHTKVPTYNISFKENKEAESFDFESIINKQIEKASKTQQVRVKLRDVKSDFDTLTYTDLHIGMDPNKKGNSMYAKSWDYFDIQETAEAIISKTLENQQSEVLIVDELGDFLDGYNAQTTRGGHELPQNMTNEEAYDCGLDFKMTLVNSLAPYFEEIVFNNICNDNHAGSFGYFVNSAFKRLSEKIYDNVVVNNYLQFMSHYIVNDVCFIISHGKDDSTLKFGFKPHLCAKQIEKIDHYIKQNKLYGKAERFIFKKGDSHQLLFDYTGSADFDYFNYMASSPPSQWVQNNFKNSSRGFTLESFKGVESTVKNVFL